MNKFTIIKHKTYESQERFDKIVTRLNQLQKDKDTFTEIRVPSFSFTTEGLSIITTSEYIKGQFVGHNFSNILYRELVERESPWTFTDYTIGNFIKSEYNNILYCVDFESYKKMEISKRKEQWNRQRKNRVLGVNGWGSQRVDCIYCRKTIQEMVDEYTFFGQDVL
jgi:hypothetical protein